MPRTSIGRAELETRPHILYRFYDRTGVLLYIGITVDFAERMKDHIKEKEWWASVDRSATKVEYYDTRTTARRAETAAIKAEKPLENDQHNEWIESTDLDEVNAIVGEILQATDAEQIKLAVAASRTGMNGETRSPAVVNAEVASTLHFGLMYQWDQIVDDLRMLRNMLKLSSSEQWLNYIPELKDEATRLGNHDSDFIRERSFLMALAAVEAAKYLDELPRDEGEGWRDCAVAHMGYRGTRAQIDVAAANYAQDYKVAGDVPEGMCWGPHHSGARCSRKDITTTAFLDCVHCVDICEGHKVWCEKHNAMAEAGRLAEIDSSVWARLHLRHADVRQTGMQAGTW